MSCVVWIVIVRKLHRHGNDLGGFHIWDSSPCKLGGCRVVEFDGGRTSVLLRVIHMAWA